MKPNSVYVDVTNVYDRNLDALLSGSYRVIANQGSTRSGKTYSICQMLALCIPYNFKKSISVVSPSLPHLKRRKAGLSRNNRERRDIR